MGRYSNINRKITTIPNIEPFVWSTNDKENIEANKWGYFPVLMKLSKLNIIHGSNPNAKISGFKYIIISITGGKKLIPANARNIGPDL